MMLTSKVLRQWALQTSLKGVPRALRAERCPNRFLWWLGTVGFLCLAFWQGGKLIQQYLQYNYGIKEVKWTDKYGVNADEVTEPAFTFCNLNPFDGKADDIMDDLGLNHLRNYSDMVMDMTYCYGCEEDDMELLSVVRCELLTSRGYFALVGPEVASKLSHKRRDFIAACHTRESRATIPYEKQCTDDMFTEFMHPDYYSCWTMQFPQWDNTSYESITLVFHLNNFFTEPYDNFPINQERGQFLGALMTVNNARDFPDITNDAIFLPPGGYLDIKLDVRGRERLGEPYNECTEKDYIANTSWHYAQDGCFSHCIETVIMSTCGCRSLDQLNLFANESYPMFCLDSSNGTDMLLGNMRCAVEKAGDHAEECAKKCIRPCWELNYEPRISSANWPPDPFGYDFYDEFIRNKSYTWQYDYLPDLVRLPNVRLSEILHSREVVSRNFLRVDIYLGSAKVDVFEDVPTLTLVTLISNLGGTLNLFAGITIVIIVEILDLLLTMLSCDCSRVDITEEFKDKDDNPV